MKRRVVLTGATGFLGSYLLDSLIESDYEVICFIRNKNKLLHNYPSIEAFELDITKKESFSRLPILRNLDAFFHLAAYVPTPEEARNNLGDEQCLMVNVLGTYNVLDYFNKCGAQRFIYSSSMCVYGKAQVNPVKETHPLRPSRFYGLSKVLAEQILKTHTRRQCIILRLSSIYGLGNRAFFMDKFINMAINNKDITIYGTGDYCWDNVYIKDAVQANLKALDYRGESDVFNIGSGAGITINDLVSKLINTFSKSKDIKVTHNLTEEEDQSNVILDIAKAKKELEYVPEYSLDKGLTEIESIYANSNRL